MDRLTENKIILVVRQTRLDELVAKYNTLAQAQFYVVPDRKRNIFKKHSTQ